MVFVGPAPRQRPDLQPYPYRQHLSQEMQLTFHSALAEMCVAQPSNENVCTKFQTRSLFFLVEKHVSLGTLQDNDPWLAGGSPSQIHS